MPVVDRARRARQQAARRRAAGRVRSPDAPAPTTPTARSPPRRRDAGARSSRSSASAAGSGSAINSGLVLIGTIGRAATYTELGVIGDPVNVAARVQDATRDLGEQLLVTEATRCLLDARRARARRQRGSTRAARQGQAGRGLRPRTASVTVPGRPRVERSLRWRPLTQTTSARLRPRRARRPRRRRDRAAADPARDPEHGPGRHRAQRPAARLPAERERRGRRRGARARLARARAS